MSSPELHLATGPLREVRLRIVERLAGIAERVGTLAAQPDHVARAAMQGIVRDLATCLRPHLRWEERTLHPIVDRYACEGPAAFSTSLRYEHEIIYRWIDDLEDLAGGDRLAFARRADNLLGLVLAHFELEEHVLFPVLDRSVEAGGGYVPP